VLGFVGLVIVIVAPYRVKMILRAARRLPLPDKFTIPTYQYITTFLTGIHTIQSVHRSGIFTLLTTPIWLVDAFTNTIVERVLSRTLTINQGPITPAAPGLSSVIPSTPGFIGVYQFVAVVAPTSFVYHACLH
jgi:glycosyltransferase 2 family protein